MKKVIIPLLALAMILLTSLLLGATSSQFTSETFAANQSGLTSSSASGLEEYNSSKQYTEKQLALIDKAMEGIIKSIYLSEDSKEYQVIATQPSGNVKALFEDYKVIPSSLMPVYLIDMTQWVQNEKFGISPLVDSNGMREINGLITDYKTEKKIGHVCLAANTESWECASYNTDPPYNIDDLYINRVSMYESLQGTKLDLSKTTGKYTLFQGVSTGYYLTDGEYEYFLAVGDWYLKAMDNTGVNYFNRDVGKEYKVFEIKDLLEPAQKQVEADRLLAAEVARQTAERGGLLTGGDDLSGLDLSEPFNPLWIILPAVVLVLGAGAALLIVKRKRTRQDD